MKWRQCGFPLICGVFMIAACFIGSAYVLVIQDTGATAAEHIEPISAPTATERPSAETPSPAAEPVKRCVDWKLTKVLVEMDIRNPSPEHEAFLREYNRTQEHCEKGE